MTTPARENRACRRPRKKARARQTAVGMTTTRDRDLCPALSLALGAKLLLLRERAHGHGVVVDFNEQDSRAVDGVVNHAQVPGRSVEFSPRPAAVRSQSRDAVKGEVRAQRSIAVRGELVDGVKLGRGSSYAGDVSAVTAVDSAV